MDSAANSPTTVECLELATGAGSWRLGPGPAFEISWSTGAARQLEWPETDPPDFRQALTRFDPASAARLLASIERASRDGRGFEIDLQLQLPRPQGRALRCCCTPDPPGAEAGWLTMVFVKIGHESAAVARAAELVKQNEVLRQRWRVATDGSGLGIWELDVAADQILFSDEWKSMLGHVPAEIGTALVEWQERLHPADRERAISELQSLAAGDADEVRSEQRLLCADGRYKWFLLRARVIDKDPSGRPLRLVGTHADIDRQKFVEDVALQASARFEAIFNAQFQFIGVLSPEGLLQEANETAIQFTGRPRQELIGRPFWECPWWQVNTATVEQLRRSIKSAARGETVRYNVEVRGHDNQRAIIDFSLKPVMDEDGDVIFIVPEGRVITDLVRAQQSLDERERLFRAAFDGAPIGTAIVGLDGRCLQVNTALCDMLGYDAKQLSELTFQDITHPEDLHEDEALVSSLLRGERSRYSLEKRYLRSDGSTVLAQLDVTLVRDPNGAPVCFMSQVQDITERARSRKELMAEKRVAQETLASISDAVIRTDAMGRIDLANPAACALLGMSEGVLRQARCDAVVVAKLESESTIPADLVADVIASGQQRVLDEPTLVLKSQDGMRVPVTVDCAPLHSFEGGRVGAVLVIVDVTQARSREQALIRATTEAEAGIRAKSEFLANMSHEIRTPMNAITGMLELLNRGSLADEQRDYVDKAVIASRSLVAILNDILDFSKIEAGKLELDEEPFELSTLMREVGTILAGNARGRSLEVLFDLGAEVPEWLVGDSLRLKQILLNVGGNAIKFTEHGHVLFRVRWDSQADSARRLRFEIEDTGIGMTRKQQSLLFKSFQQVHSSNTRRFGGTGLGLAISGRLAEMMGGDISVDSDPGRGTCFTLRFPLSPPANAVTQAETLELPATLRALVVDDSPTAREVARRAIASLGWQSEAVESGEAAEAKLREGGAFDLILLDWKMPGRSGLETAEIIRQINRGPNAPVVLMTTAYGRGAFIEAHEKHARPPIDGLIEKPYVSADLARAVCAALGGESCASGGRASQLERRLEGLSILVVEDNLTNQQIARELLASEGAVVSVAGGGRDGVVAACEAEPPFDVILMDVQMPDIDGFEATQLIRADRRVGQRPIIAMTANASAQDRARCLKAGMDAHVAKPFHIDHLVQAICDHCGRSIVPPAPMAGRASRPAPATALYDFESARRRLGGVDSLFAEHGRAFATDQADFAEWLSNALLQTDQSEAKSRLHSFKGLCGTLGLVRLNRIAAALEEHLRSDSHEAFESMAALAEHLPGDLQALLDEAKRVAPRTSPAAENRETAQTVHAEKTGDLRELSDLLARNSAAALEVFEQLEPLTHWSAHPDWSLIREALARFDFRAASKACERLLSEAPKQAPQPSRSNQAAAG